MSKNDREPRKCVEPGCSCTADDTWGLMCQKHRDAYQARVVEPYLRQKAKWERERAEGKSCRCRRRPALLNATIPGEAADVGGDDPDFAHGLCERGD